MEEDESLSLGITSPPLHLLLGRHCRFPRPASTLGHPTVARKVKYEQAAPNASAVDVEGVRIPLTSLDDLIEIKRTGRLQDAADIEVLEEIRRRGS